MNTVTKHFTTRQVQGFVVHVMNNGEVELVVVPELGAKIISLKNLRTRREWLWRPKDDLKLFNNRPSDDFSASPLVGMDECLPTILPCSWRDRELPDHGEVWNQPWTVDKTAWRTGVLTTSIRLKISPFVFQRTIELQGNEVRLGYKLSNLNSTEEPFIWAIHPLLRLTDGDELVLPASTRVLLNGAAWVNAIASAVPKTNCAKIFACPVSIGSAAINNEITGDRLEFAWQPRENKALGLWLTRGGWHGHHHFAIEPTNANDDSLVIANAGKQCGRVAGNSSIAWQLSLKIGIG
jgi:hypothetical protein